MLLFNFLRPGSLLLPAGEPAARPAAARVPFSRARIARRGRAAVVGGLLFFAMLQLTFFPLSDPWPAVQDAEYGHKLRNLRRQVRAKPADKPTVVMFGSSLTGWALCPGVMTDLKPGAPGGPVVFNMGVNSSGVVVRLMCLKRVLADGIRPDLVLMETHPWFLFEGYNFVHDKDHFFPPGRLQPRDLFLMARYDPKPEELLGAWAEDHLAPWYAHRHDLQNNLVPHWVRKAERTGVWDYTDRHGWEGGVSVISPGLSPEQALASASYHVNAMANAPLYPEAHRAYREIVRTCQQKNLPLVLVRMPEMRVMWQTSPPAFRDKVQRFYDDLQRETGVAVVDARSWVDDAQFRDGFHLHPPGAAQFSQRLERELLAPVAAGFAAGRGK